MSDTKDKIARVLKIAMKSEEDGWRFYDLLARKVTNKEAKRKLQGLRDDEIRHQQTLKGLYKKYVGGEVGPLPEKGLTALNQVFAEGQPERRTSEMEFVDLAIEAELAATKYYQEERQSVDDSELRQVFDNLAAEEHMHYELLMAEREALAGNYYWFDYDGTSAVEH